MGEQKKNTKVSHVKEKRINNNITKLNDTQSV